MPTVSDDTTQRDGLHRMVRRFLDALPEHPAWPAYLARSVRAQAHHAAARRLLARMDAGETVPLEELAREADGLARVSARLRIFAETGLTRDG